jgi:peptidoglycan hydrolase-like protein with peptidoglycan-binding domain
MRISVRTTLIVGCALPFLIVWFNLAAVAQEGGPISSRPTFDCAKARSPLALLICSGEETARADWDLRVASWARYFSLDEDDRAIFWNDQDQWLRSLNQKCRLTNPPPFSRPQTSCVTEAYRARAALYRSKLTGNALAESKLTPEELAKIQQALIALGFLSGEADGEFGLATRAAIKKYQEANNFPQSDYLSMQQRQALLAERAQSAIAQRDPKGPSANQIPQSDTAPRARQDNRATQRPAGEFARLMQFPTACQTARELGQSQLWARGPFESKHEPGPTCRAVLACLGTLRSQLIAGIQYLKNNPAVFELFRNQVQATSRTNGSYLLSQHWPAMASGQRGSRFDQFGSSSLRIFSCNMLWDVLNREWLPPSDLSVERFVAAGQAVLAKVRTEYTNDEAEYRDLMIFNDRYTGVEDLERAYATYRRGFEDDDIAAVIRARPIMLQGLEQARARKQLLTQQSAQVAQYEQTLADFGTAIDREGLMSFADQRIQTAMGELRGELARLSQTAPAKRGDISAKLEIFATRIRDVDSTIRSAQHSVRVWKCEGTLIKGRSDRPTTPNSKISCIALGWCLPMYFQTNRLRWRLPIRLNLAGYVSW